MLCHTEPWEIPSSPSSISTPGGGGFESVRTAAGAKQQGALRTVPSVATYRSYRCPRAERRSVRNTIKFPLAFLNCTARQLPRKHPVFLGTTGQLPWAARTRSLEAVAADAAREAHVGRHDRHALGMHGADVAVLEQPHHERLRPLLQARQGLAGELQVRLEVLGDLAHEALERELLDELVGRLLVLANLTQSHGTRAEAVRLLHGSGGRSRLPGSLRSQLLARSLATGGLAGGHLRASHLEGVWFCHTEEHSRA